MANLDDDLPLTANYKQLSVRHYQLELQCDLASRVFRGRALLSVTPGPEWAEHSDPASLVLDCSDIAVEEVSLLCGDPLEVGDGGKLKTVHCSFSFTLHYITYFLDLAINEVLSSSNSESLSFSVNEWSLAVRIPEKIVTSFDVNSEDTIHILISFNTLEETRSLHWRRDSEGNFVSDDGVYWNNQFFAQATIVFTRQQLPSTTGGCFRVR